MELTRSDCEILGFLRDNDFTDQYRSATLQEIMQITKNSRPTTYRKMMNLCEYGFVRKGCKAVNANTFYLDSKAYGIIGDKDSNANNQQMKKRNIISQKRVQYNIAQTLYLWEKFSLYTLTKSVKIPSISNKLGTDFTVVRVPQIDPSVALFPV